MSNHWTFHNVGVPSRYWENEEPKEKPQCKHEWVNISLLKQRLVCKLCDYEMDEHGNPVPPKSVVTEQPYYPHTDPYVPEQDKKKEFLEKLKKAKGIFNGPPVVEEEGEDGDGYP